MRPPVRTVCVVCLHSVELSSGGEGTAVDSTCPYCGHSIDPSRNGRETSTTGEGMTPPVDPEAQTPRDASLARPMPERIGRFVLREPLGEGGYGQVFRAHDPHLDREVALKVLKPNRLGEKALERFLREARAAARLDHPNIVTLHDAGRDDQRCWIAYQLVPGRTLSRLRDQDQPSIDESVRIVRDLARALDHAHGRGVYHRDLKPANVLIDDSGRPRLTDFGLARRVDLDSDLTQEGTILGTPQYMSPEAAAGRAHTADGRSDVYSLGVILYELICGRRPADVPSDAPLWRSTRIATPPTPRSVDRQIPARLDRVCMRALAFDPDARYPGAGSFGDALDAYLEGRPIPNPRRKVAPRRRGRRKGNFLVGLLVTASAACIALGVSLHVVGKPAEVGPGREAALPAVDLIPPSRPTPSVVEPAARVAATPAAPVAVRSRKSTKYHVLGCPHVRPISTANYLEIPYDVEAIKAQNLIPCDQCQPTLEKALDRAAGGP